MKVVDLLYKLVMDALKNKAFMPMYQDRTDGMDDIIKAKEKRDGIKRNAK